MITGYQILKEHQKQNDIANKYEPFKKKCKCGHTLYISEQNKKLVCHWCGRLVFLHEEDEKKNNFKEKMRRLLNE